MHPEGTEQGIPLGARCPRCRRRNLEYLEAAGVWWVSVGPDHAERVVVGIPALACKTPGCLWAAPHPGALGTAEDRAKRPGDAAREYIKGRLKLSY